MEVISNLDDDFYELRKQHIAHTKSVATAIDWFNNVVIDKATDKIAGSAVVIQKQKCLCIENNFRGYPFFECYLIFIPIDLTSDIGSGVGRQHKVDFK